MDAQHPFMEQALALARCSIGRSEPNPRVGCVIVAADGRRVLGEGSTQPAGQPHAEIMALRDAASRGHSVEGATVYVTLEPCSHHGRTGPCADRIIAAGIRRVVAAMEDPFPQVNGRGFVRLREHGIEVMVGVGRECAVRLNQPFLTSVRQQRPFVILSPLCHPEPALSS